MINELNHELTRTVTIGGYIFLFCLAWSFGSSPDDEIQKWRRLVR